MFKLFLKTLPKVFFYLSAFVAISIDTYYKFNLKEGDYGYYVAFLGYSYFCAYLAVILVKLFIKIKSGVIKSFLYALGWITLIITIINFDRIPEKGVLSSFYSAIFITFFFSLVFFIFYLLFRIRKFIATSLLFIAALSVIIWSFYNESQKSQKSKTADIPKVVVQEIQPWQLNSRYKINNIVKFLKVDLDKDGIEEIVYVYNKVQVIIHYLN